MNKKLFSILNSMLMLDSILLFLSCESIQPVQSDLSPIQQKDQSSATLAKIKTVPTGGLEEATVSPLLGELNQKLIAEGKNIRIAYAEWMTNLGNDQAGRTVYFSNVGNKQLAAHWVAGDPNRDGRTNITWLIDQVDGTPNGASRSAANTAIATAMSTWDGVPTTDIPLTQMPDFGLDWGYVQWLMGKGGMPGWFADVTHSGFLDRSYFDLIAPPDGGDYILGVTHTLVWIDTTTGEPTDMDNNNKLDVAFREIYYNNEFSWGINAEYPGIDIESIALHEMGHGLSQAHFGTLFRTLANGKYHFSPMAVMNAGYVYIPWHELMATDLAGHNSIWASWPKN